jgi:hypothetical protein
MPAYHITPTINLPSILTKGLIPSIPKDMDDLRAVYLFPDYLILENAMMNWMGDRFDEEISLSILTIDTKSLILSHNDVGFEVISFNTIPPETIMHIENLE